jgi:hypothetical protein
MNNWFFQLQLQRVETPWGVVCNYGPALEDVEPDSPVVEPTMDLFMDDSELIEVSQELTHADVEFPYFLILRLQDMEELGCYEGDGDHKYVAEICVACPADCPEAVKRADGNADDCPAAQAVNLVLYGKVAIAWQGASNDRERLLAETRGRLGKVQSLLPEYLDQRMNACGNTGWQAISDD